MTSNAQDNSILSVSINLQEKRILEYLTTHNTGINRYEADAKLNICMLSARISELKSKGYIFYSIRESASDLSGRKHPNIVRHWLRANPNQGGLAK